MKKTATILATILTGAVLGLSAGNALADGRGHDHDRWEHRHHDHGWKHGHDRYYYYDRGPVVYAPAYFASPPPPVIYRPAPAYYGYRPEPAITIGVGIPPIVIPLR